MLVLQKQRQAVNRSAFIFTEYIFSVAAVAISMCGKFLSQKLSPGANRIASNKNQNVDLKASNTWLSSKTIKSGEKIY